MAANEVCGASRPGQDGAPPLRAAFRETPMDHVSDMLQAGRVAAA
jgi:hypothetical protein